MTVYQYNRLALTVNCEYTRTAIRELSKPKRRKSWRNIEKCAREEDFRTLFDLPTFKLKEELFVSPNLQLHHPTPFDRYCDEINACFSKKWHPTAKRIEYLDIFSICRWKELPESTKKTYTLGYCSACYNAYPSLQAAFPGKPLYEPQVVVTLASRVKSQVGEQIIPYIHRGPHYSCTRI